MTWTISPPPRSAIVSGVLLRRLLALVLLLAAGAVGWRVLAPAEVLAPATDAFPAAPERGPGVTGRTAKAPLIVAGRIRVYAAKRQVKADAPVDARTTYTPRWSLRRWPQQLNGVVAIGSTVVSRWSDGELVAIDGATGRIAWRVDGPAAGSFTGSQTGAATVWTPPGMFTSAATVLVRGGGRVTALDVATGANRWQADCRGDSSVTAGGQLICGDVAYEVDTGKPAVGWPVGPYGGVGCGVARSGCAGFRDGAGHGWLTSGRTPQRANALDAPGSVALLVPRTTADGRVISAFAFSTGATVVARSPLTGGELWRWTGPGGATVLGSGPDLVLLLTGQRHLVTVNASTGEVRNDFPLSYDRDATDWQPGSWQAADGYIAIERLSGRAEQAPYFSVEPVLLADTL